MKLFDKSKIKSNFNKVGQYYNQYAVLQKIVADKLVGLSQSYICKADNILDLGSGTGFVVQSIFSNPLFSDFNLQKKQFVQLDIAYDMLKYSTVFNQQNSIFNVNADIESLPFKNQAFDLVISSLSFQWLNNLDNIITEIASIIKPIESAELRGVQGILAFSVIADGSLKELKTASKQCNVDLSINDFMTSKELKDIIISKFANIYTSSQKIVLEYDDIYDLLKSIKIIGAGYSYDNRKNNLIKSDFDKINSFYLKNYSINNKIISSWEIFYAICRF